MTAEPSLHQQMLNAVPSLRAFAISLTGNTVYADDLVQTAILRGLEHLDTFQAGTSMQAWLFTILRNHFYTEHRRRRREIEDADGALAAKLSVMPVQDARLDLDDMMTALAHLSNEQREALLLIAAEGMSYEEAAQICGTNIGTIKSRINRARTRLTELLELVPEVDLGPDRVARASVAVHAAI